MKRNSHQPVAPPRTGVRCAIYTRKSTEKGLEQEFNSLDAQREAGEAFVKSQAHEGWTCLPDHYDDGGFTGGNTDRPALQRLVADIEAGKVDSVVVYKIDRLSRSLLDFSRLMETFEKHHVSFVSVTQQFNTACSMGRLMLNVLLSFAQFEREIISERTRDKIAAARRKGKWAGGHPLFGYDIDPKGFKLVVNEDEAHKVRSIFQLYLDLGALLPVVQELARRDWRNKRWSTRKNLPLGGKPFTKTSLHKLLTNVAYCGKVRYKLEVHPGEHQAIVDQQLWQRVQVQLQRHGRSGGGEVRNRFGAVLKGLIRCVPCGCAMVPSHTTRQKTRQYRYYVCSAAQKNGWHTCPSKSVPAPEIERFVIDRIQYIGQDPALLAETFAQVRQQRQEQNSDLEQEMHSLQRDLARWNAELRKPSMADGTQAPRLADLQERIAGAEQRSREVQQRLEDLDGGGLPETEIEKALLAFQPIWQVLTIREQTQMLQMLIQQVDYHGGQQKVTITFHPMGLETLAERLAQHKEMQACRA